MSLTDDPSQGPQCDSCNRHLLPDRPPV